VGAAAPVFVDFAQEKEMRVRYKDEEILLKCFKKVNK
jgi:hypothetical protein